MSVSLPSKKLFSLVDTLDNELLKSDTLALIVLIEELIVVILEFIGDNLLSISVLVYASTMPNPDIVVGLFWISTQL